MAGVAVILHERIGNWARQLRPRLHDRPARWIETRSAEDLAGAIAGLCCPVILVDLGENPEAMLPDLAQVRELAPGALMLVLDPGCCDGISELAAEFGATLVVSGFVAPPEVAGLVDRWIGLAARRSEAGGWSRPMIPAGSPFDPLSWLGTRAAV